MSFAVQEQVLFDLLFNRQFRERFIEDKRLALQQYELTKDEINDFLVIKPEALALDAKMRAGLLLSHISRSYPVSFCLISSLSDGLELLRGLVDIQLMHTPPRERATSYGKHCHQALSSKTLDDQQQHDYLIAIFEAELGMARTAAMLKQRLIERAMPLKKTINDKKNWANRTVELAAFVNAVMLPQPYANLKKQLCPKDCSDIWRHISQSPLTASRRSKILQQQDNRLLITRARMVHFSRCEPVVEHQTIELSEGFAHLFQHVNGTASVTQLLAAFKQAGAPDGLLKSVKAGLKQLINNDMLTLGEIV